MRLRLKLWRLVCVSLLLLCFCSISATAEGEEWLCSHCGATNTKKFCVKCGAKRETELICPNCGEKYPVELDVAYCGECGAKLLLGEQEKNNDSSKNEEGKQEDTGIWEITHYVDEFNNPTYEKYIRCKHLLSGKFSNSATDNSELSAQLLIDGTSASIMLYEYGDLKVKTYSSSGEEYLISVLDNDGVKHSLKGTMYSDRITMKYGDKEELLSILAKGGSIRFSIVNKTRAIDNYSFSIVDATGFKTIFKEFSGREIGTTPVPSNNEKAVKETATPAPALIKLGTVVSFGNYEQDNDDSEKEPIEWIVIDNKDNKVTLISKYVLRFMKFEELWTRSAINKWLNDDFVNEAFDKNEASNIVPVELYSTEYKVYILDSKEAKKYQFVMGGFVGVPVKSALAEHGMRMDAEKCHWWLRNTNALSGKTAMVTPEGKIDYEKGGKLYGIRPVVCVNQMLFVGSTND